jgi:hypothetical protein
MKTTQRAKHPGRPIEHGEATKGSESVEYRTWARMKNRCTNPNHTAYPHYGGRGIAVCDRWMGSFEDFLEDMGRRPTPQHSIDRIDNDGDYEPGNCRWATKTEQSSNYSRNRVLEHGGRRQTLSQWANEVGVSAEAIASRIDAFGWSVEKALTTQLGATAHEPRGKDRKTHCANGHKYTPENSGRNAAGWRFCRICSRERSRDYMKKRRAAPS